MNTCLDQSFLARTLVCRSPATSKESGQASSRLAVAGPRRPSGASLKWLTVLATVLGATLAQAQVAVSESGTPSYSHPIVVPPGVAGMAPQLSLFYGGGGVNGPVGHGWSVQGLSVITRCPATFATDGKRGGVNYGATDKLCLDGQRLLQTDESGNPQAPANAAGVPVATQVNDAQGLGTGYREFRTEKDTYARIRAYGYASDDATGASGPKYFKVWTKAGQIYEYGASPAGDTNTKALITAQGKTVAMAWAVARISDTLGNRIDFKYEQRDFAWGSGPTADNPTPGREWNILEIQYSGNKVIFNYADRVASSPQDAAETYHKGSKNVSVRLLQSITTYVNAGDTANLGAGAGVAVKTVKLTYDRGSISGRSRVVKIQECAGGANSTRCLPGPQFTYAEGGNEAYQASAAFNLATLRLHSAVGNYGVLPADFDADGKTDIIRWADAPAENRLYFSDGDGSFTQSTAFNITDQNLFKSDGCYVTSVADFDGNGLPDLLRHAATTSPVGTACSNPGANYLYLNQGGGSFIRSTITGISLATRRSTKLSECIEHGTADNSICLEFAEGWTFGSTFYILDADGDSKLDIVVAELPARPLPGGSGNPCLTVVCTRLYKGDGQGGFAELASTNLAHVLAYSVPDHTFGGPRRLADLDGDGLSDLFSLGVDFTLVYGFPAGPAALRSRGDGNFDPIQSASQCSNAIDFNADGRSDCLWTFIESPAYNRLRVSVGAAVPQAVANFNLTAIGNELFGAGIGYAVVDMNGDGRQDILRWKNDATQNALYLSNGDGTFAPSASFSLGGAAGVQLKRGDATVDFVTGDFTGRGTEEILRVTDAAATTSAWASQNHLYIKTDATPLDQLVTATSPGGARTSLYYVPLSNSIPLNGVSAAHGERYRSDRGTANAAASPLLDLSMPMWVIASSVADSGVGSARVNTEYSYAGLKADINGRGMLGFREVRQQTPGPNGQNTTVATRYLHGYPYTGVAARTDTYLGELSTTNPVLLSSTVNLYCDAAASEAQVQAALSSGSPCPATTQPQRPYLLRSVETGADLQGAALPQVVTQNRFNASGDPTQIVVTTTGLAAGINQTFTKTTANEYRAEDTACSDAQTCNWVRGRLHRASVTNSVPNALPSVATSAGSSSYASATVGTGRVPSGTLAAVSFGGVAVGSNATLNAVLSNTGLGALTITVPTAASVSGTDFSFVSTSCASSLAEGASCSISVRFAPSAAASRSGSISVATSVGTLSSSLAGIGNGSVATLTSAASQSVAAAWYGAAARSVTATYRNDGTTPLSLAAPVLAAPLSISSNGCSNVAVGVSCSMVISVAGNVAGLNQGQSFAPSGAINTPAATTVTWSTYTAVPRWSSTSLSFGSVTVGTSATQSLTLTNDGNTAYNWASNSAVANAPAGYSLNTSACASVAPGGSCAVVVTFAPTAAGSQGGSGLTMAAASYSSNSFSVSGTGLTPPSITASTTSVSASAVSPTAATGTVSFTNTGQTPTTLTLSVSGGIGRLPATLVCPANGSCGTVTLNSPTAVGVYSGTLSMASSAGGSVTSVAVSLTVTVGATIAASPSSVAFGTVPKPSTASRDVTIRNNGAAPTSAMVFNVTNGAGTAYIGWFNGSLGTCPAAGGSLAPGASCTYVVSYESNCGAGNRIGSLTITGANFPSVSVSLSATTPSGICN
jgi:hypothetical protein